MFRYRAAAFDFKAVKHPQHSVIFRFARKTARQESCEALLTRSIYCTFHTEATMDTAAAAVQQTPMHGDVITPESIPPIPSAPPLNAGADPAGLGPAYIGHSGPMVYPQAVSNPPPGMQAVAGNFNLQEEPPPSYDSLVPGLQPSQQPHSQCSTLPTNNNSHCQYILHITTSHQYTSHHNLLVLYLYKCHTR